MRVIAIKDITEVTENNIEHLESLFEVRPEETVEQLMTRLDINGSTPWHFNAAEVRLKLVKDQTPQP